MGIDDTKRRIGTDKLDNNEKKKLFKKFQDHGGKVIDEEKMRRLQMFDKEKQKNYLNKKSSKKTGNIELHSEIKNIKYEKLPISERFKNYIGKIKLYFKSFFQNVMDSSGKYLSNKFFIMLKNEAQSKLLDLELLITPLAHGSPELRQKLQFLLNKSGIYYYELILRMDTLYNEREFVEILNKYNSNKNARITPESIGEPLRAMFKRLYILRKHNQSCINALSRALEIQAETENKDKIALKRNIQHAKKDLSFICGTLFPKLYIAILNILKRNYPMEHKMFIKFLELKEEDRVGYLTDKMNWEIKKQKTKKDQIIKNKKREEEKIEQQQIRVSKLSDTVKLGLKLMNELKMEKENLITSKESIFNYLEKKNKMYLTEALFNEMEKEYIFLLTSNQIKIAMDYQAGKKTDIKQEFSDLYIEFDNIRESIEEFNKNVVEAHTIERSPHYSISQKSQLLHKLSLSTSKSNNQIRNRLGTLLIKIEQTIKNILNDYNNEQHLLQNPDDIINFDVNIGKKKKLENRSVIDSIIEMFHYITSFKFRLIDGDLSGYSPNIDTPLYFDDEEENKEEDKKAETELKTEEKEEEQT